MTLSRFVLLLTILASISAYAADPKQQPTTTDASVSATTEPLHLVPWFTGMKHVNQDLKRSAKPRIRADRALSTPSALKGVSCLKLRSYKVRGQETLSDNESAFVSYSTCQWVANYQVRSAVQTIQEPAR
jgi:hypothetical protein